MRVIYTNDLHVCMSVLVFVHVHWITVLLHYLYVRHMLRANWIHMSFKSSSSGCMRPVFIISPKTPASRGAVY